MPQKPKLSIPDQVTYMRDHCGITFQLCSEESARRFLSERNYFFKVKAFAKNYNKDSQTGKYVQLDFAYLQADGNFTVKNGDIYVPMIKFPEFREKVATASMGEEAKGLEQIFNNSVSYVEKEKSDALGLTDAYPLAEITDSSSFHAIQFVS